MTRTAILAVPLAAFWLVAGLAPLAGCHWPGWAQVCLGGTTTPSEACIVAGSTYGGVAGGIAGAHALNHDPYNAISEALSSHPDAGAKP